MNNIKCSICGKYIKYSVLSNGQILVELTPDSYNTLEKAVEKRKEILKSLI